MWTRTLSTTISTRPLRAAGSSLAMLGLSHAGPAGRPEPAHRPRAADRPTDEPHDQPENEPADVGEEGDLRRGGLRAERGDPAQQLQDEPEPEQDDRRHLEQLEEEAEEHDRQDAGSRIQHEVRAEDRGDRARGADDRAVERWVDRDLAGSRGHPT